jgi:hypothetical protein
LLVIGGIHGFKFVLNIGSPGNVAVVHGNVAESLVVRSNRGTWLVKEESVREDRLRNKSARVSDLGGREESTINGFCNVRCKVRVCNNGVTVRCNFVNSHYLPHELLIGARADVAAMVLIVVVQLVIGEDGTINLLWDVQINCAALETAKSGVSW